MRLRNEATANAEPSTHRRTPGAERPNGRTSIREDLGQFFDSPRRGIAVNLTAIPRKMKPGVRVSANPHEL